MEKINHIYNIKKHTPSDINEHLETIFTFSQECLHITELGVRHVTSTWPMLLAGPRKLISYDLFFQSEVQRVIDLANEYGLCYRFIEADVLSVQLEKTELLFIDTLHTYNQLTAELILHSDKVSKYIILHDTNTFGEADEPVYHYASSIVKEIPVIKQGLMSAVKDFLLTDKGQSWELFKVYTHNNGLTILKTKEHTPSINTKKYIENNINKWNHWHKSLPSYPSEFYYSDTVTYKKAAEFLKSCETVEDWGVGGGGFLRYRPDALGVDGSNTPFAQKKNIDLKSYTSKCDGVCIRHVLEHNYCWEQILKNALSSASKKIVIIVFTPFNETETKEIAHNLIHGVDVPDLSLNRMLFLEIINEYIPKLLINEKLQTATGYGIEEIFYIEL